ncbi:MAG: RNA-binding protein [Fibrobacteres bacterium]|nr:RNA-binding protein [Fibrobacterota bacterium]
MVPGFNQVGDAFSKKESQMNIYVSNIPYQTTEDELRDAFAGFGNVSSARIIKDKLTGKSRGFGFVEMANDEEAKAALEGMNGAELTGRKINAREARPREEGPGGGAGAGGGFRRDTRPSTPATNRGTY